MSSRVRNCKPGVCLTLKGEFGTSSKNVFTEVDLVKMPKSLPNL